MADEYQRGSDLQWLEHSNQELARLVKKRERTIAALKLGLLGLGGLLGWVLYRYAQLASLRELWPTP